MIEEALASTKQLILGAASRGTCFEKRYVELLWDHANESRAMRPKDEPKIQNFTDQKARLNDFKAERAVAG